MKSSSATALGSGAKLSFSTAVTPPVKSGKARARRSLLEDDDFLPSRGTSPASAKRMRPADESVVTPKVSFENPSPLGVESPKGKGSKSALGVKPGAVNQTAAPTPQLPSVSGTVVKKQMPDVVFNTYENHRRLRQPVPREELFRALSRMQTQYPFPAGCVLINWGNQLQMDLDAVKPHFLPEDLETMEYGPNDVFKGQGPAHLFVFLELVWSRSFEKALNGCRRAWTIVHFHRAKHVAILWDLSPELAIRRKLKNWALHANGAFANYTMQYREADPDPIPASEWFAVGQAQLCTLKYWLEYYQQYRCAKELERNIASCPSGFFFNRRFAKETRDAEMAKDAAAAKAVAKTKDSQ